MKRNRLLICSALILLACILSLVFFFVLKYKKPEPEKKLSGENTSSFVETQSDLVQQVTRLTGTVMAQNGRTFTVEGLDKKRYTVVTDSETFFIRASKKEASGIQSITARPLTSVNEIPKIEIGSSIELLTYGTVDGTSSINADQITIK